MEFQTAITQSGYEFKDVMENIGKAVNCSQENYAETLFEAWKASPSHYEAMINDQCTEIGIAIFEVGNVMYGTQHFGVN